jgi:monovalent cation:H+ antiporter-2, CPA2 family
MGNALVALGGAFLAAGVLARMGRRIGLPTIPLFMLAGIIFGPHTPGISLVDDPHDLELLAALGLVMLLFHLGLEFSLGDLVAGGKNLFVIGAIYLAANVGGGLAFGFALGWGSREALVIAGAIGISSSAIVTKLLTELHRLANPESRLILGIIVVEDVFIALYLAILQPVIGDAQGIADIVRQFSVAFGFLLTLLIIARYGASFVGRLINTPDDELLTVCFVGLAVLVAGIAEELHVSDAIGAFMVGLVLAETVVASRIERLVLPLRDAFAAVFFFAFGLTINPDDAATVTVPVLLAVALTFVCNGFAGAMAARIGGFRRRQATNIALTTLGRGELSLVLAALATDAGLDSRIGPFVAEYVLILAIVAPIMAARSGPISKLVPERWFARRGDPAPAAGN